MRKERGSQKENTSAEGGVTSPKPYPKRTWGDPESHPDPQRNSWEQKVQVTDSPQSRAAPRSGVDYSRGEEEAEGRED